MPRTVDQIFEDLKELLAEELEEFRVRYAEFESARWDEQLENDVQSGKLDSLAEDALSEHRTGKTTQL